MGTFEVCHLLSNRVPSSALSPVLYVLPHHHKCRGTMPMRCTYRTRLRNIRLRKEHPPSSLALRYVYFPFQLFEMNGEAGILSRSLYANTRGIHINKSVTTSRPTVSMAGASVAIAVLSSITLYCVVVEVHGTIQEIRTGTYLVPGTWYDT